MLAEQLWTSKRKIIGSEDNSLCYLYHTTTKYPRQVTLQKEKGCLAKTEDQDWRDGLALSVVRMWPPNHGRKAGREESHLKPKETGRLYDPF